MDSEINLQEIPFSKSLLQRLLLGISLWAETGNEANEKVDVEILKEKLQFIKNLRNQNRVSDDVVEMAGCVESFLSLLSEGPQFSFQIPGPLYKINLSATAFRLWALRLSFVPGHHCIQVSRALAMRPWQELHEILPQFGARIEIQDENAKVFFKITGQKVSKTNPIQIQVPTQTTSHWISGLEIIKQMSGYSNLNLVFNNEFESKSYFELTQNWLLNLEQRLAPKNFLNSKIIKVSFETDLSSLFFEVVCRIVRNRTQKKCEWSMITKPLTQYLQPDRKGFEILQSLGIQFQMSEHKTRLISEWAQIRSPESISLGQNPDLFPVLAVLLSQIPGPSELTGLKRLDMKESRRVEETLAILDSLNAKYYFNKNSLRLEGANSESVQSRPFVWKKTAHDHRIAMATRLAQMFGAQRLSPELGSVTKSFPQLAYRPISPLFLIGHRGVGKTSMIKKLSEATDLKKTFRFFDLDTVISEQENCSIEFIFKKYGEKFFRELEIKTLKQILEREHLCHPHHGIVVSLGAGFSKWEPLIADYPAARFFWLQRETDFSSRVFIDRPRLNELKSPSEEYLKRAQAREAAFQKLNAEVYIVPEGAKELSHRFIEKLQHCAGIEAPRGGSLKGFGYTLTPRDFDFEQKFSEDIEFFEIRNDLFKEAELITFVQRFSDLGLRHKLLISLRTNDLEFLNKIDLLSLKIDCDVRIKNLIELKLKPLVYSYHGDNLTEGISALSATAEKKQIQKLVLFTDCWNDLRLGHDWMMADQEHRVFLPATPPFKDQIQTENSREPLWKWYRLWLKSLNPKLNFFKTQRGEILDQPSEQEVLNLPEQFTSFAAVLGMPIEQSFSADEHRAFFLKRSQPFFKIPIVESETHDFEKAFEFLDSVGLKAAAVTSPYKQKAFHSARVKTQSSLEFQIANTLVKDIFWQAHLTDLEGLRELLLLVPELPQWTHHGDIVVWGGGAMQKLISKLLPHSVMYSASQGQPREKQISVGNPQILIWGSPTGECLFPNELWQPRIIVDLGYTQNSKALEYFQKLKGQARYISGYAMFSRQAALQRQFWKENL
jgi:5-enolpyruvylshikimate-3-phosphate synthase/shikimate kinase/shikimate 5-dehydrogenase